MTTTHEVHEPGSTWAGSHRYGARGLLRPRSLEELCEIVAGHEQVRALGSRHSFTDLADTAGYLVDVSELGSQDRCVELDDSYAWVGAGATYAQVARELDAAGLALPSMASLPHITVAGAVATGTHGSGDGVGSLARIVSGLELVTADGSVRVVTRAEPDFAGHVVALGALGVVTRLALEVEPTFDVRQDVLLGLGWEAFARDIDTILSTTYSVSVFTDWQDLDRTQVWLKSRVVGDSSAPAIEATRAATAATHMLRGGETEALTAQLGEPGSWHDRLPHFRAGFTPSRGAELQSEYFVPRRHVAAAVSDLQELGSRLGPRLAEVLQVCEVRSIAGDELWLSGAYGEDTVGFHWTWVLDQPAVYAVLPELEATLAPYAARPHWGKCFTLSATEIAPRYPRWADFARLRDELDPARKFGNAFLERVLGS